MNLQNWVNDARKHWKEFSPKLYRSLQQSGQLEQRLQEAAEQSNREMNNLRQAGFNEQEAWEQVRERYLFTPEELKPNEKLDNPWLDLLRDVNHLHRKLLRGQPETD